METISRQGHMITNMIARHLWEDDSVSQAFWRNLKQNWCDFAIYIQGLVSINDDETLEEEEEEAEEKR
jgi:hypothetical protein